MWRAQGFLRRAARPAAASRARYCAGAPRGRAARPSVRSAAPAAMSTRTRSACRRRAAAPARRCRWPTRLPPAPMLRSTIVLGPVRRDDLDVDRIGASAGASTWTCALEPIPRSGPEYSQSLEDVVGERFVVGHHVEEVVDLLALLRDVDGRRDWFHVPDGTLTRAWMTSALGSACSTRAIDYVAANGIGDLSLRALAAALGTSHRMLIHHFGSKEGLWVAIVHDRRGAPARVARRAAARPDDADRARRCGLGGSTSPTRRCGPTSACSSSSTARRSRVAVTRPSSSTGSSRAGSSRRRRSTWPAGFPASSPGLTPALGIAVTRGLLLDLLATGDVAGVDAAMDAFIDLYEAWVERAAQLAAQASQ